jgi:hypothetical protein
MDAFYGSLYFRNAAAASMPPPQNAQNPGDVGVGADFSQQPDNQAASIVRTLCRVAPFATVCHERPETAPRTPTIDDARE